MSRSLPHIADDRNDRAQAISRKIDAFFEAGRELAKELVITWFASLESHANETNSRIVAEIAPAPIQSDKRERSVKELAAIWGVSIRSIYKWKDEQGLPFKKRGRLLRFDPIKADQWEQGNRESFTKARLRVVK